MLDETAPIITCPADITIDCRDIYTLNITGKATAKDNCDDKPIITYKDEVIAGDCEWECTVKRTWMATDACGNSSNCIQTILRTSVDLVKWALAEGPIELGRDWPYPSDNSDNFLSISAEAAQCLVDWLPGTDGTPRVIPNGHYNVDEGNCIPYEGLLDENGKITNSMLSEMLILAVNLRLNPEMVDIPLKELACTFHPIVYQHMRGTPTIGKMYTVGINYLGNVYGPNHQPFFKDAIRCINTAFKDRCEPIDTNSESVTAASLNKIVLPAISASEVIEILNVFPNPTSGVIYIDFNEPASQSILVRIYNIQGKVISEQKWDEALVGTLPFYLQEQPSGIYLVKAFIRSDMVLTSKVILTK
ncbi:MAG: T9SS type A sorting domain-containing protein [Saprospiraceae bacterium]|nr:T9SS type A sorting domain-containing protein [Saprospiraceae bacterium]